MNTTKNIPAGGTNFYIGSYHQERLTAFDNIQYINDCASILPGGSGYVVK
ncbi:hypothetical protein KTO58_23805 [Chitinophaga pendula]|nr:MULTISPECIES: hypothetical protein [Chitinophaga]UCJ06659.1 hypothetical protein KTO58_23805 [Chitinophaga pendula]